MANQKGGLHKKVDAIFGDYSAADQQEVSPNNNSDAVEKKSSFPGNIAVSVVEQEDNMSQSKPQQEKIENKEPEKEIKKEKVIYPELPEKQPAKQPQQNKKVMLPAALTSKPKMGLIDRLKVKMEIYVEENGTRQLYSLIAIPVLTIVLIFFVLNNVFPSSHGSSKNSEKTSQLQVNTANTSSSDINWQKPDLHPANLRDPMRKASITSNSSPAEFQINGIVYMEDEPEKSSALIGKMTVFIGDQVNGAKVVDIQPNYVVFEVDGKTIKQGVGGK